jgi:hypothetical protein
MRWYARRIDAATEIIEDPFKTHRTRRKGRCRACRATEPVRAHKAHALSELEIEMNHRDILGRIRPSNAFIADHAFNASGAAACPTPSRSAARAVANVGADRVDSRQHEQIVAFAAGAEAYLTSELALCACSCGPDNLHLNQLDWDLAR